MTFLEHPFETWRALTAHLSWGSARLRCLLSACAAGRHVGRWTVGRAIARVGGERGIRISAGERRDLRGEGGRTGGKGVPCPFPDASPDDVPPRLRSSSPSGPAVCRALFPSGFSLHVRSSSSSV